jgi:oligopeptide/dipeptide ABC transporter ATP-binding protein
MTKRDFLIVDHVSKRYALKGGGTLPAVRDVSFTQSQGETLGVVGESGCGKSTLARLLLHLTPPSDGAVYVDGDALGALTPAELRRKRRDMQMIFQDPQASLDPRMRVGDLLAEPLIIHRIGTKPERQRKVAELCALVGLPEDAPKRYPHEFSGGQRQRIAIARALTLEPALIVADEPVSALDVSIQAQILNLLVDIRGRFGLTYVFISHDLAVIRHISDTVAVMYLGEIVEMGAADDLFAAPAHPYAQMLIAAVLEPGEAAGNTTVVKGEPPNPEAPPSGCSFHPRCPMAMEKCRTETPPELDIGQSGRSHRVRCWLHA